jgi:flagellar basal-body rod protein FlgC
MMKLLPGIESASSALQAERIRLEVIGQNIANANTTKTAEGGPYKRQLVQFETVLQGKLGVTSEAVPQAIKHARIIQDQQPARELYQPTHPDADPASGMVRYPNVDIHEEMADMIAASRAYEANLAVVKNSRTMTLQTLSIGRH